MSDTSGLPVMREEPWNGVDPPLPLSLSVRGFGTMGLPFTHYLVTDGLQGTYYITK
jgi:hypothetical protein